ncbi:ATP-binding cassette domain-containing protein [Nocardia sp. CA-119907]|uniref:ATP-binding cassette domain-containing protein n=1 Tax=Nocardia sp. CA-119907 TaxID=3239973 RepID=UPI003D98ED14
MPSSRRIAELGDADRSVVIQGPEHVALIGPNGAGKSTLIENLLPGRHPTRHLLTGRVGYLPHQSRLALGGGMGFLVAHR